MDTCIYNITHEPEYSGAVKTRTQLSVHANAAKNTEATKVSIGTISGKVKDYKYHMACILRSDFG